MSPDLLRHLLLLLILHFSLAAWAELPQRVIVLELQRDQTLTRDQAHQVRQELYQALRDASFEIIDPRTTDKLFKVQSACVSVECLGQAARQLAAHYVVGGRMDRVSTSSASTWTVVLWIFDAHAQATVATAQGGCEDCQLQQALRVIKPTVAELLREARDGGASARLHIHSRPEGAAVSINGRPMGVTNMSFGVVPGQQRVILNHSGYQAHQVTVEVKPGQEITLQANLKTLQRPDPIPLVKKDSDRVRKYNRLKWILTGSATAAFAVGVICLAQGKQSSSRDDHQREETSIMNYTPAGIALTTAGAALAAGALLSLFLEHRAQKAPRFDPQLEAGATGITLRVGGRF